MPICDQEPHISDWWNMLSYEGADLRNFKPSFCVPFGPSIGPGKLIVIEGMDGSGKTTLANSTVQFLRGLGVKTKLLRFPSESLRTTEVFHEFIASKGRGPLSSLAQELFYMYDRVEGALASVGPTLREGAWVVSDRYVFSSLGAILTHSPGQFNAALSAVGEHIWFRQLCRCLPRPDAAYVVLCEIAEVEERLNGRGEIGAIGSYEHYDILVNVFQQIAEVNQMYLLNTTSKSPEEGAETIQRDLMSRFDWLAKT